MIKKDSLRSWTEKLDNGKNIIQKSFFINKNDSIKILKERTQKLEHRAFPEAIIKVFEKTNF